MYNSLIVHVYQSPGNVRKLIETAISDTCSKLSVESYELKPIYIPMRLDKPVDISVCHPLRHHHESVVPHRDSQERKHAWVAKGSPR